MKPCSVALAEHLMQGETSVARLWKIKRKDVNGSTTPVVDHSSVGNLVQHTNFSGETFQDGDRDNGSFPNVGAPAVDRTGTFYVSGPFTGAVGHVVHMYSADGAYLGVLGSFGVVAPILMKVLYHPTRGIWLVAVDGVVYGENVQCMSIAGLDDNGAPIAPGTITNYISTTDGGLSSGGNSGSFDVDTLGNIWTYTTAAGGAFAGLPYLTKISFIGSTTIAATQTDMNALYGWTHCVGMLVYPGDQTLILANDNDGSGGHIVARINPADNSIIVSSASINPTIQSNGLGNIAANGEYISLNGTTFYLIDGSCLEVVQTYSTIDYGFSLAPSSVWYDGLNGFAWMRQTSTGYVFFMDLSNPTPAGAGTLSDSFSLYSDPKTVLTSGGNPVGNASGSRIITTAVAGGGPDTVGFVDIWLGVTAASGFPGIPEIALGFTDHDVDIVYDDGSGDGPVTYVARTGMTCSANESKSDMSVDNLSIDSFLESDLITEADLRGGLYDSAECKIMIVNWADLTQGHVTLRYGVLGNVHIVNQTFVTEIRGLTYKLGLTIGSFFGPLCRAELFSDPTNSPGLKYYCNLPVGNYQVNGSVESTADALHIVPAAGLTTRGTVNAGGDPPVGYYDFGILTYTSGANNNMKYEVEHWDGTTLTFEFPMLAPPAPGDTFIIEPGCDKLLNTCVAKFGNGINHRGEPWIPGLDVIMDFAPPS